MLPYPHPTSREEKQNIIKQVTKQLHKKLGSDLLALGLYGSVGKGTEGAYSDIEMHVFVKDGTHFSSHEFIYEPFKIELSVQTKTDIIKEAQTVDDGWSIKAGVFTEVQALYDPTDLFTQLKKFALNVPDSEIREVMKEFMIWEPYETMGKIRNNYERGTYYYLPWGAKDLSWQTAKLIGLANRMIYSTRSETFKEAVSATSKPSGFENLAELVMKGDLADPERVYLSCENLWTGLNDWFDLLGIDYRVTDLPF
ncbi:kanamycin nucleotidyltransferase C-terminal domain-containing protein [Alteribacter populi]|uniref:kanamycin nucleotidyltransferase C-terminal domain-containing protein n=1 Tax=Alteribacter populi TaxID=2011011 RepID=UPI000BBB156E|nr:kanamycin nucleotidyltransferase C-terminal domain-containing protein [Alteribacter populi]